jgi:hypothetical protein
MARPPLPPGEEKILWNARIDPDLVLRLKVICFRKSVAEMKKFSEGGFVEEKISEERLPNRPTQEAIDAYAEKFPKLRDKIMELAKLEPPKKQ